YRRPPMRCSSTRPSPATPSTPSSRRSRRSSWRRSRCPIPSPRPGPARRREAVPGGTATCAPPIISPMTLDAAALDRLYKRTTNSLLRYFQRRVADPELATDLMADTFTTVLELRDRYRGTSEQELSGWLWRIAQSTLREHEERGRARARGSRQVG